MCTTRPSHPPLSARSRQVQSGSLELPTVGGARQIVGADGGALANGLAKLLVCGLAAPQSAVFALRQGRLLTTGTQGHLAGRGCSCRGRPFERHLLGIIILLPVQRPTLRLEHSSHAPHRNIYISYIIHFVSTDLFAGPQYCGVVPSDLVRACLSYVAGTPLV